MSVEIHDRPQEACTNGPCRVFDIVHGDGCQHSLEIHHPGDIDQIARWAAMKSVARCNRQSRGETDA